MKHLRKVMALVLAAFVALVVAATPAYASDYKITVTNTNTNISIAGKTYTAYKLFDATYSGTAVSYTIDKDSYFYTTAGSKAVLDQYFTFTTASGDTQNIVVTPKEGFNDAKARELADKLQPFISGATEAGHAVASGETATIDAGAPGYYIVDGKASPKGDTDEIVAAVALTTAKPTATVNPKADGNTVDKTITGIASGTDKVEEGGKQGNGSVGDKVEYKLASKVPDMTGYKSYQYIYTDTMSKGLTFNDDVVVKIGETTIGTTASDGTYYTLATETQQDGSTKITITFSNFIKQAANKGQDIEITYSATINQNAVEDGVEPNTVTLKYSENPYDEHSGTPDEVLGETPDSTTKVYSTNIELTKVDKDGNKLTKAKFGISGNSSNVSIVNKEIFKVDATNGTYYRLKDGTYTTTAPTDATADQYDDTTTKYAKVTEVNKTTAAATGYAAEGWVKSNSTLTFNGLGEGTYTITELVSPEGYNLLSAPISVVVTFNPTTEKFTATVDGENATVENNVIKFDVENNKGTELPSTGGMGTRILYTVGGIMLVGGAIALVSRKRVANMEK